MSSPSVREPKTPAVPIQSAASSPLPPVPPARREDPLAGILLILSAVFFFSCSDGRAQKVGLSPAVQRLPRLLMSAMFLLSRNSLSGIANRTPPM